jgi:hypothetical protein
MNESSSVTDRRVTDHRRGLSRRAVVRTAVWSTPAISVIAAAPAQAAFSPSSALSITSVSLATSNRAKVTGREWYAFNGTTYTKFTETATTLPATITNPALLTTTVSGVQSTGGAGSEIVTLTLQITGQTTSGTTRGHGQYHTFDTTNWVLSGTPTINNTSKLVTFTFLSAAPLAAGGTVPDLVFTTAVGSTSGGNSYAITAGTQATATATAPNATAGTMTGTLA